MADPFCYRGPDQLQCFEDAVSITDRSSSELKRPLVLNGITLFKVRETMLEVKDLHRRRSILAEAVLPLSSTLANIASDKRKRAVTFTRIVVAIMSMIFLMEKGVSQACPANDQKSAAQFLLDYKVNSTRADRNCVDRAIRFLVSATQFKNKSYIPFLVGMLDFERSVPEEGYKDDTERKYPVIADLVYLSRIKNVIPSLVRGIKESDSEVLRTNAAETLLEMNHCLGLTVLNREADKEEIPFEQRERLETAVRYIVDNSSLMKPCEAR